MPEFDPFKPINPEEFKTSDFPKDDSQKDINPTDVGFDAVGNNDMDLGGDDAGDDAEASLDDFESELGAIDSPDTPDGIDMPEPVSIDPEPVAPEKVVKWTAIPTDNNELKSKHVGGFILRARSLSAKQGKKTKYMTQLFKDKKILEKGVIWIDDDKDPLTFLQNISDRVLNRMGLVSNEVENKPEITPEEPLDDQAAPEAAGTTEGQGEAQEGQGEAKEGQDGGEKTELDGEIDQIMGSI